MLPGLTFAEAVVAAESRHGTIGTTGSYTPPRSPGRYRGAGVGPSPAYSFSAAVIEVIVDEETGLYDVEHVWIAHDVGQCINPVLMMGQIEGSVYMGLGEAIMEEQVFRRLPRKRSGALVHKFPSMLEYKSPTFHDMPPVTTSSCPSIRLRSDSRGRSADWTQLMSCAGRSRRMSGSQGVDCRR